MIECDQPCNGSVPSAALKTMVTTKAGKLPSLLDTGASVSIVEQKFVSKNAIIATHSPVVLNTPGSDPNKNINVSQKTMLKFCLGDVQYNYEFLIVPSLGLPGIGAIIGLDFLQAHKACINLATTPIQVFLHGRQVPILHQHPSSMFSIVQTVKENLESSNFEINKDKPSTEERIRFFVAEETDLPPQSICNIKLTCNPAVIHSGSVLVTPVYRFKDNLAPESVVHMEDNLIVIPFFNPARKVKRMCLGEIVAFAEPNVEIYPVAALIPDPPKTDRLPTLQHLARTVAPSEYGHIVTNLMSEYSDVFTMRDESTGFCDKLPFSIDTGDHAPLRKRAYRVPVAYQPEVDRQLKKMEKDGIIQVSQSPWHSPVVIVRKKGNDIRLCVDYRFLNSVTKDDAFPLPVIDELLNKVTNAQLFSTLDLKSGYHQVAVDKESQEKTAFSVNDKLFHFCTLPFGLKNAPGHFSRLMHSVLAGLIGTAVLIYLDDIIVVGSTLDEHIVNLKLVLEALRRHNLKVSLEKCQLLQKEVTFLGHKVSPSGIMPMHDKVQAIKNYARPKNPKQVMSFLGLASYYRKFIPNFAKISRPLDELRKTDTFLWQASHEEAFQRLKDAIQSDCMLKHPDFNQIFYVTADASHSAIGGVISQLDSTGKDRPLSFASRTLKGAELQYSVLEKEALAILFLLEKHKFILLGHKVAINSDHRPLANLFKKPHNNARHQRWVEGLLQYNIVDFQHIAGKSNFVADALSRAPPDESRQDLCAITRSQTRAQQMAQDTQNSNQLEKETSPQGSKDSLPTVERTFPEATPQGQPGPVSDFECMRAVDDLDGCADEWSVKGLI